MALFGLLFVYFAKESIDTKCGFVRLFLKKVFTNHIKQYIIQT